MIKITYICDKCGKEVKDTDIFELLAMAPADGVSVPGDVMAALEGRHICRRCLMKLFSEKGFETDEEGHRITKRAEHVETPAERDKKKVYYLNKANELRAIEMYKAGKEIEEISDELMVGMAPISRLIHDMGLGAERYKGQYIPSDGSQPVVQGVML